MHDPHISNFLSILFKNFNASGLRYCVLRQYFNLPVALSGSDLDILVDPETFLASKSLLLSNAKECGFNLIRETPYGDVHFFHFYKILDEDFVFIRVDLNQDQRYFGACFLTAAEILDTAAEYRGIKVAHPVHEALLSLIFPLISSGKIKEKHIDRIFEVFRQYPKEMGAELAKRLGVELSTAIVTNLRGKTIDELSTLRGELVATILSSSFKKRPIENAWHLWRFIRDITVLRLRPPGCVVLLYHPDGIYLYKIASTLFTKCSKMMLGEHKLVIRQTRNGRGQAGFLNAFMTFFLGYYAELKKYTQRHGIVFFVSDINLYISSNYCKSLLSMLSRVIVLDIFNLDNNNATHTTINNTEANAADPAILYCMSSILNKLHVQ